MDAATGFGTFPFSQEDVFMFHDIDRKLYTILVIQLLRDPVQSMHIMALWLWLERVGFDNTVKRMLSLPHTLINELADEAVICLNIITMVKINDTGSNITNNANDTIPMTQNFMKKDISVHFFHKYGLLAAEGMEKVMKDICVKALSDIMHEATKANSQLRAPYANFQRPRPRSVFPQVIVGQHEVLVPQVLWGIEEPTIASPVPMPVFVPPEDRTMFVTFSKGYPVADREVREFFIMSHGDCIESLSMQEVQHPRDQALFARVVFKTASTIDMILDGKEKIKFTINGKHVWARKYVPKKPSSSVQMPSEGASGSVVQYPPYVQMPSEGPSGGVVQYPPYVLF